MPLFKNEFCHNCKHLSVTEAEQKNSKEIHFCKKFKKRIKHQGYHPSLPKLQECIDANR